MSDSELEAEDLEILQEFIVETREHLEEIEPDLLAMEQKGGDVSPEIINRIFRAIHSTKGGASFLNFTSLKDFSHVMENVLMRLRDGHLTPTPELIDVLLRSVDVLRAMIDDVQASDMVPCAEELQQLDAILQGELPIVSSPAAAPSQPAEPAQPAELVQQRAPDVAMVLDHSKLLELCIDIDEVQAALAEGMHHYEVELDPAEDLAPEDRSVADLVQAAESVGRCLWTSSEPGALAAGERFTLICATVLDEEMLAMGLQIPKERIRTFDTSKLQQQAAAAPKPEEKAATESNKAAVSTKPAQVKETLRVQVEMLNRLMNTAGELVLGRNQLLRALERHADQVPGLVTILQHVDRVTTELQEGIMQTRMQPVGSLFSRYSRVVRDMARNLGKEISLETTGSEVELDKSIIELLADPLTHIIRNCVDHAIEPPEERAGAGKARMGRIALLAFHEGGQVNITITDDGRGIDPDKVLRKAVEQGLVRAEDADKMSHREIVNLVMVPGFSTAEQVSEISGRGVGMDVVRTNIEKLGGHIELETEVGNGTTVLLQLPLTLAIIPSLVVGVGQASFAVPQVGIVELVLVKAAEIKERIELIQGSPVLRLRGQLLPLVHLADVLGIDRSVTDPQSGEKSEERRQRIADRRAPAEAADTSAQGLVPRQEEDRRESWRGDQSILVLRAGSNQFGVIVDELFEPEEIVVKPLSSYLKQIKCFAGTTILGDGHVIMILDTGGVAELAQLRFSEVKAEEARRRKVEQQEAAAGDQRSVILFNSGDDVFAVPQGKVLRLESINLQEIEQLGEQRFIQYRGAGLPVLSLDEHLPVKPPSIEGNEAFLIIPKVWVDGEARATGGILVSRIIDAMDLEVDLQQPFIKGPGVEGMAIVKDQLTLFLDPVELLQRVGFAKEAVQ
jgi:two-component system, chemotaxis family, sensor kinase CheA